MGSVVDGFGVLEPVRSEAEVTLARVVDVVVVDGGVELRCDRNTAPPTPASSTVVARPIHNTLPLLRGAFSGWRVRSSDGVGTGPNRSSVGVSNGAVAVEGIGSCAGMCALGSGTGGVAMACVGSESTSSESEDTFETAADDSTGAAMVFVPKLARVVGSASGTATSGAVEPLVVSGTELGRSIACVGMSSSSSSSETSAETVGGAAGSAV